MDRATWDQLKVLRERTGAGLNECRPALAAARGNIDDAVDLVQVGLLHLDVTRFLYPAQVHAAVSSDARTAVLVELSAPHRPRDHAEVLDPFFTEVLAIALRTPSGADLAAQPLGGATIGAAAKALSEQLGLPIDVRRWTRIAVAPGASGLCASTMHSRRELGAIVLVTTPSAAVAAHPATRRFTEELVGWIQHRLPRAIARADLDPAFVAEERARIAEEALRHAEYGMAPDEVELWKQRSHERWTRRSVLLEQPWGWQGSEITVDAQRRTASIEAGGELRVERFAWFARGDRECMA